MKKVIYSAMIGGYDDINAIKAFKGWDCVMFTDMPKSKWPQNSGWDIRPANTKLGKNSSLVNRWYKMHPHILFPEYDYSLYIDANIIIKNTKSIDKRIKELQKKKIHISMPEHFARNCIYDEAKIILNSGRDSKRNINKTVSFLRQEDYPANNGLYENNFIYRKHNDKKIIALMEEWWLFINKYSRRDQMSLCYLLWKNQIKSSAFFNKGISVRNHPDFIFIHTHKKSMRSNLPIILNIKRKLINLVCLLIPIRSWRHKLRGKNNEKET